MERIIPFDTELPCKPRLLREPQGGWLVKSSPSRFTLDLLRQCMDKSKGIAFWGGYLGGRKEQPQPAAGAVGLQGCHLQNCQPLIPPDPAAPLAQPQPSQSSPTPEINSGSSGPAAFPFWDGASRWVQDFTSREDRGKTKN